VRPYAVSKGAALEKIIEACTSYTPASAEVEPGEQRQVSALRCAPK
jgi:hypothetical protein